MNAKSKLSLNLYSANTPRSSNSSNFRLIQYDCGKLQRLDRLLSELKAGSHRALIFTQMTKVLDILERFLNYHGYRYLRLDGTTRVDTRLVSHDYFFSGILSWT